MKMHRKTDCQSAHAVRWWPKGSRDGSGATSSGVGGKKGGGGVSDDGVKQDRSEASSSVDSRNKSEFKSHLKLRATMYLLK